MPAGHHSPAPEPECRGSNAHMPMNYSLASESCCRGSHTRICTRHSSIAPGLHCRGSNTQIHAKYHSSASQPHCKGSVHAITTHFHNSHAAGAGSQGRMHDITHRHQSPVAEAAASAQRALLTRTATSQLHCKGSNTQACTGHRSKREAHCGHTAPHRCTQSIRQLAFSMQRWLHDTAAHGH